MRSPVVVVLGDINVDVLARVEAFLEPGGDYLTPELHMHCGGVGANAALALARWGAEVRLLGCVGCDWFGEFALGCLRAAGIDVRGVQQSDRATTGLMFIAINPDGQRTIFGSRAANAEFSSPREWSCLADSEAAHLVGYAFLSPSGAQAGKQLVELARQRGARVSLDVGVAPSRQIPQTILEVARKVDILFVSSDEAAGLVRKQSDAGALAALHDRGVREVVLKRGPEGCAFLECGELHRVPPIPVTAVDTTGAGDAFAAAFLCARLRGRPGPEAALLANAAGAAAAAVVGAGEQMPGPREVASLLRTCRLPPDWEPTRARLLEFLIAAVSQAETTDP